MSEERRRTVTKVLTQASKGDEAAEDRLWQMVYDELRRMAHRHLQRERQGHTLQTTEVVHEAYLRLVDQTRVDWKGRGHFFRTAAMVMRRLLVDYARRKKAEKRGGGRPDVPLDEALVAAENSAVQVEEILAVDQALSKLAKLDGRMSRVVEGRYFGGLTDEEIAEATGVSERTVRRDWKKAKGWLRRELS